MDIDKADFNQDAKDVANNFAISGLMVYKGGFKELMTSNLSYEHSVYAFFDENPFDGNKLEMAINSDKVSSLAHDSIEESDLNDSSSGWFISLPRHKTGISMISNSVENIQDSDDWTEGSSIIDMSRGILDGIVGSIEEIEESMEVISKVDIKYTVLHEALHTDLPGSAYNAVDAYNIAEVQAHKMDESIDSGLVTQVGESISDVGSIIYMSKHKILSKDDVDLALKGLILRRMENTIWSDYDENQPSRIGDVSHNTLPALISLMKILESDPNAFDHVSDKDILAVSENIVRDTITTPTTNPYPTKAELSKYLNDPKNESSGSTYIDEAEYLTSWVAGLISNAEKVAAQFNIKVATKNTQKQFYNLRSIDGDLL